MNHIEQQISELMKTIPFCKTRDEAEELQEEIFVLEDQLI